MDDLVHQKIKNYFPS